jgi:periplasmic divalent cation tolerance protein
MNSFMQLVLKCGSHKEAQRIAAALLEKHLVACVEFSEVKSKYHWRGIIEEADEIKLTMESVAENFEQIEKEVAKLHSYDTFVLQQIPVTRVSKQALVWWLKETNPKA